MNRHSLFLALSDAFDNDSLARLVRFGLNESIEDISLATNLKTKIFDLTRWAEANNKTEELLVGAIAENPTNEKIRALLVEMLESKGRSMHDGNAIDPTALGNNTQVVSQELVLINFQLTQVSAKLERLYKITIGEDGDSGLRDSMREVKAELENVILSLGNFMRSVDTEYVKRHELESIADRVVKLNENQGRILKVLEAERADSDVNDSATGKMNRLILVIIGLGVLNVGAIIAGYLL